jgi:hypothetical protein
MYIYLIKNTSESYYKIGVSNNPKKRIKNLNTGNSSELILIQTYETKYAYKIEKNLHRKYSYLRKYGEWFDFSIVEENNFLDNCKKIENGIITLINCGNVFI